MSDLAANTKRKGQHKSLLRENQTQKRRERANELRSQKRDGILAKRRKTSNDVGSGSGRWSKEEIHMAMVGIKNSPLSSVLPQLVSLRKLLSLEDPPIEEVVEGGIGDNLIALLSASNDEIQIEATWCLTNIASGHTRHTESILGAAPQLINFLSAPNPRLQEQALWTLGNIAGDSVSSREMLHANGALLPMARLLQNPPTPSVARTAAWALSNLARGQNTPAKPFLDLGLATSLADAMRNEAKDRELAVEAGWVLAFLTAKDDESGSRLVQAGIVSALVEALVGSGGEDPLCTPVLRSLGNLVSGPEEWADAVLAERQFLFALCHILQSKRVDQWALVKEATWAASNVVGGSSEHREALLAIGALGPLVSLLLSGRYDVVKEAAFAVWNMVSGSGARLAEVVQTPGVLEAFVGLLKVPDQAVLWCGLSFLRLVCESVPGGAQMVEQCRGLEAIDDLHYGQVEPELSACAASIVDEFFGEDYGDGAPGEGTGDGHGSGMGGLVFGTPATAGLGRGKHLAQPAWMQQG